MIEVGWRNISLAWQVWRKNFCRDETVRRKWLSLAYCTTLENTATVLHYGTSGFAVGKIDESGHN
jgi:hypothetical protein